MSTEKPKRMFGQIVLVNYIFPKNKHKKHCNKNQLQSVRALETIGECRYCLTVSNELSKLEERNILPAVMWIKVVLVKESVTHLGRNSVGAKTMPKAIGVILFCSSWSATWCRCAITWRRVANRWRDNLDIARRSKMMTSEGPSPVMIPSFWRLFSCR